jgi:hypothetical protein
MRTIKIGTMIYHQSRYWKSENLQAGEVLGWNARYLPYVVTRVTEKTIYATGCGPDGQTSRVQLPRTKRPQRPGCAPDKTLEAHGKQYHSRFHEYFYVEIPKAKSVIHNWMSQHAKAVSLLGLTSPFSADDVRRAYKKLALKAHPDVGGSHNEFIRLKEARDIALRGY